ncbi:HAD-IIIA family hydrolase [bacterium]|nr:HAD-IIIA family hydrolase [bacterium]
MNDSPNAFVCQAVIQAGGKGSRLGAQSAHTPKPLTVLHGKPVLEWQLEWCAENGIREVFIVVNHLGELIENWARKVRKSISEIRIECVFEAEPLGTAGILPELSPRLESDFVLLYGDVIFDIDLSRLTDFHYRHGGLASLVVHPNDHPHDSDLLECDDAGQVRAFHPKPHEAGIDRQNLVNAALYLCRRELIEHIPSGRASDFGKDLFPALAAQGLLYAYRTPEYLKDMGTPERIERVAADLASGKVRRRNLKTRQKAVFLDRDGVLNYDTELIHRPQDLEVYPFAPAALQRINRSDYLSVGVTNQSVVARGLTDLPGLRAIHNRLETALGEGGAFLDDLYFCPHHPDGGFPGERPEFKIDCDCRKPKPGMSLKAAERYHIDLKQSWMVGDSERDVLAGRAAGCRTIGVRTGHGLKKSRTQPDLMVENLEEAVQLILDQPWQFALRDVLEALDARPLAAPRRVILVGGNSRSGKSTFSRFLSWELEAEGVVHQTIRLDDWILPKSQRPNETGVLDNFQIAQLVSDLERLVQGETVQIATPYAHHPDQPISEVEYHCAPEEWLIIEGVVALMIPELRDKADLKVFVSCPEMVRKQRFVEFYRWKGRNDTDIETLYALRNPIEYIPVEESAVWADIVV